MKKEKYKTLLKDIKEDIPIGNRWFKVARVFKKFHSLIVIHIWKSKEHRIARRLMNKKGRDGMVMKCVCLFYQIKNLVFKRMWYWHWDRH